MERSMCDRPSDAEVPDWYEHCNRLARWRHSAEQARKEFLEGRPTQLRELYNFWRNLARFRSWGCRPPRHALDARGGAAGKQKLNKMQAKGRHSDKLRTMPREAPTEQVFDYDSEDAERIGQLLEQVRQNPEQKQAVYQQLDEMISGLQTDD
jgi:hypothetical protein